MAYDFTTLSPEDFEDLAADLLACDWGARVETFKRGKDRGIDLRHTRVLGPPGITIVQCKRYAPYKFTELVRAVKKEKAKIGAMRPTRYVLATSVPLSPDNKDALMSELQPWCRSTSDIYGASELNGLLRKFPDIERGHFKLWIASTAVLERVLHSSIFNVTQATIDSIKAQLSRIVMHQGFDRALLHLREEHHVLIVGNPGIGKTTLARMLLCHYLKEDFEPLCVVGDIRDAWSLIHSPEGSDRKFVVLYDDFLGRYRFDSLRFAKNEEFSLMEFLDKVRRSPNLRFILSTREYFLADAQRVHGAFATRANEILKCTLRLEDYSKTHRAKILFNHLYFSDLPDSRLTRLVEDRIYKTIVEHKHFSPRIVETISAFANSRAMTDGEYVRFVQREFDNPAGIWEHPFRNDISPVARAILMVLWTFGGTAELESLKAAVRQMINAEGDHEPELHFVDGIRQLDGNFISTNRYPGRSAQEGQFIVVQFSNPSVEEFVDSFLKSDATWIERLIQSIVCFPQVSEITTQASSRGRRRAFNASFWASLRKVASSVEHIPGGHLINYRPYHESARQVWDGGGTGVVSLGFSGGASANISAGVGTGPESVGFYDPGLSPNQSLPQGSQNFVGSGDTSDLVNAVSGGHPGTSVPGCGHDVTCAIQNSAALQALLQKAGPCNHPTVFTRNSLTTIPMLPLNNLPLRPRFRNLPQCHTEQVPATVFYNGGKVSSTLGTPKQFCDVH